MATITGINLYVKLDAESEYVKHNTTALPLTNTAYDLSDRISPGDTYRIRTTYVYDDGGESDFVESGDLTYPGGGALEPEVAPFMSALGIPNDATTEFTGTPQERTGAQLTSYVDTLIKDLKNATGVSDLSTVFGAIYPRFGGSENRVKYNLLNPQDTDGAFRASYFGSWIHDELGSTPDGSTAYVNTNISVNADLDIFTAGGLMGIASNNPISETQYLFSGYGGNTSRFQINLQSDGEIRVAMGSLHLTGVDEADLRGIYLVNKGTIGGYYRKNATSGTFTDGSIDHSNNIFEAVFSSDNATPFSGTYLNQTIVSTAYYKADLTEQQITDVIAAFDAFENSLGRKTW